MAWLPPKPGFPTDFPELPPWATARWVWHAAFWSMYAFSVITNDIQYWATAGYFASLTGTTAILVGFTYLLTVGLIPYLLYQKKFILFGFIGLALCFIFNYVSVVFLNVYCQPPEHQLGPFAQISTFILFMFMITGLKFGKDWMLMRHAEAVKAREQAEIGQEKVTQEMSLLKEQLSPHFLFNTLNNLYGLAVSQSRELPSLMLRLSELLRYSLYETAAPRASLGRELEFIRNYVMLEQIRCGSRYTISLALPVEVPSNRYIAPMMLIVLVENAFKHTRHLPDARILIDVRGEIQDGWLVFSVHNTAALSLPKAHSNDHSGIGLDNLRRRLAGLYEGQHTLHAYFEPESHRFIGQVTLHLDSHV